MGRGGSNATESTEGRANNFEFGLLCNVVAPSFLPLLLLLEASLAPLLHLRGTGPATRLVPSIPTSRHALQINDQSIAGTILPQENTTQRARCTTFGFLQGEASSPSARARRLFALRSESKFAADLDLAPTRGRDLPGSLGEGGGPSASNQSSWLRLSDLAATRPT